MRRMDGEDQVGVRELYANVTADIRFAKRQQWTVAYYVLLVHAAIAGLYRLLAGAGTPLGENAKFLIVFLGIAATLVAVYFLGGYQKWLQKSRAVLARIHRDHATDGFLAAGGGETVVPGYFKDWSVLLGLTVLTNAGAALLAWLVLDDLGYALKMFPILLVVSALLLLRHKVS